MLVAEDEGQTGAWAGLLGDVAVGFALLDFMSASPAAPGLGGRPGAFDFLHSGHFVSPVIVSSLPLPVVVPVECSRDSGMSVRSLFPRVLDLWTGLAVLAVVGGSVVENSAKRRF